MGHNRNNFSLQNAGKNNIFSVPEGYFLNLEQNITNRIPELNPLLKKAVYKIPEGYFERLHAAVSQRISKVDFFKDHELIKNVYEVDKDYFGTLEYNIQNKIHSQAKVINYDFQESTILKYAIAASLTLLLISSGLFYFFSVPVENQLTEVNMQNGNAEMLIASLEKTEILQYLERIENVESQDLVEFSSQQKLARINKDFIGELFPAIIGEKEKQNLKLELEDIDISELSIDI